MNISRLDTFGSYYMYNLVHRQLGEQLLDLESDIRQMFAKHKQAEAKRKEMDLTNERGEVPDQKEKEKHVEVVDILDDLDLKEERVEEELKVEMETNLNQVGDAEASEEVKLDEKELGKGDLDLTPHAQEEPKAENKNDMVIRAEDKKKELRKIEKCDICEKFFKRKCELERHKVMHNKVYLAPSCPFCGKLLKGSIKRHILSRHPNRKDEVLILPRLHFS